MNEENSIDSHPFDPYRTWLGLETVSRPPNHYELLNLSRFEPDTTLISQAVERQTAILQMVTGSDQELVRTLIADVGQARICLLDPDRKAAYDKQLREQANAEELRKSLSAAEQPTDSREEARVENDQTSATGIDVAAIEKLIARGEESGAKSEGDAFPQVKRSVAKKSKTENKSPEGGKSNNNEGQKSGEDESGIQTRDNGVGASQGDSQFHINTDSPVNRKPHDAEKVKIDRAGAKSETPSLPPAIPMPIPSGAEPPNGETASSGSEESQGNGTQRVASTVDENVVNESEDPNSKSETVTNAVQSPIPASHESASKDEVEASGESPETTELKSETDDSSTAQSAKETPEIPAIPAANQTPNVEASSASDLSSLESDLHSTRVESQKAKEAQDQQFKVIMDKVLWASCGVALVAIIWVMIVRVSGCNREPVQIVNDENSDADIKSKKLTAGKELDLSLKSPLEKSAKEIMKGNQGKKNTQSRKNSDQESKPQKKNSPKKSGGKSKSDRTNNAPPVFVAIKETIGFFDFNEPVNPTDLLSALAPLRVKDVKWNKQGKGGHIALTEKSQLFVDRGDAFDNLKQLTFVCKFRCSKEKGIRHLVSFKHLLVVAIENGRLRFGAANKLKSQATGKNLDDGKWHQLAIRLDGQKIEFWLDGKIVQSVDYPLPEFKSSKLATTIGRLDDPAAAGIKNARTFKGSLDNLGFYWIKLTDNQIQSQFAR